MDKVIYIFEITKYFGQHQVLKDVSLSVNKGEIVSIIGPSGSGKSTLIRCINGLEHFDSGSILVEGESVKQGHCITKKTGMVFQSFNLFPHYTVLNNIVNPCMKVRKMKRNVAEQWAMTLLRKVKLEDKKDSYPQKLSGGQQQRVAIARVLAMEPAVMLLDEPTSALDPELSYEVFDTIKDLADEGLTMLIVTHQINLVKDFANRIIFLDQGSICAEGTPKEILNNQDNPRLMQFLHRIKVA